MANDPYATETWRVIPGFEKYSASSLGRIRRDAGGYGAKIGRVLKPCFHRNSYHHVTFWVNGKPKNFSVHEIVALAFIGPRPDGYDTCHNNGDKTDNRPENLRYDTKSGNMADCKLHGTDNRGERNGNSKLTAAMVQDIRGQVAAGRKQIEMVRKYRLDPTTVSSIVRRETWAHI